MLKDQTILQKCLRFTYLVFVGLLGPWVVYNILLYINHGILGGLLLYCATALCILCFVKSIFTSHQVEGVVYAFCSLISLFFLLLYLTKWNGVGVL